MFNVTIYGANTERKSGKSKAGAFTDKSADATGVLTNLGKVLNKMEKGKADKIVSISIEKLNETTGEPVINL